MKKLVTVLGCLALVFAFSTSASAADWSVPGDFTTIQDAIDDSSVVDGDTIMVGPGSFAGALVDKAVEIKGVGGALINDGPVLASGHPAGDPDLNIGFFFPGSGTGSGATISHLRFETVEFPIFSRGASNVTVTQCSMTNPIQGVSNWSGSEWEISHNVITDLRTANGGGIGIIIAERLGGTVSDNVVSHNKIAGTLHVWEFDGGGYAGSGIVLFADFRSGQPGAVSITGNRVVKNKVSLVSDTPAVVEVVAFELTEHGDIAAGWPALPPDPSVICSNVIGFNDWRGTAMQVAYSPEDLESCNDISRNLGDNRGHGLQPSVFGPGGN